MPVPKKYRDIYGKIVGHLQNIGYGLEAAKTKTDKAIASGKLRSSTKLQRKAARKKSHGRRQ